VDEDVRTAIKKIFRSCQRLTELTGRPFSPDGHLVGSFGEVAAADLLDLTLMPPSNDGYDAIDKQGRRVEIKATTRASIGLSTSGTKAERLVVVVIDGDGGTEIAYDGPARCLPGHTFSRLTLPPPTAQLADLKKLAG